ncbi:hypothetical protein ASZ90_009029 [hydrocarbon metagenome]|uniref:Uncharacterized protein n=1 Tax=hydrocarbon metagenome TaxID=938273 RepID=A0A0W8FKS5_9ZZZZ
MVSPLSLVHARFTAGYRLRGLRIKEAMLPAIRWRVTGGKPCRDPAPFPMPYASISHETA